MIFRIYTVVLLCVPASVSGQNGSCDNFESCRKIAQAHLNERQHSQALQDWQIALSLAEKENSPKELAIAYRGIGLSLWRVDQLKKALENYEMGLKQADLAGEKLLQA